MSWQGCSLGIWGFAAWSLLRTPVMEIARLMKRKQKRRSGFTDLAFASHVRFLMDMFLLISIVYIVYVDILVLYCDFEYIYIYMSIHFINICVYILYIYIYIYTEPESPSLWNNHQIARTRGLKFETLEARWFFKRCLHLCVYLAILCDFFGMVKWPLQWLSDLQLGDKKVTLNHLVRFVFQKGCLFVGSCSCYIFEFMSVRVLVSYIFIYIGWELSPFPAIVANERL